MGHMNKISLELKRPIHVAGYNVTIIDEMLFGYEPSSNLSNDLFANKIAFVIALNFPYFSLEEKEKLGPE